MAAAASSNKRKHKSWLLNKAFFASGDSINSIPFGSEIITIQINLLPVDWLQWSGGKFFAGRRRIAP